MFQTPLSLSDLNAMKVYSTSMPRGPTSNFVTATVSQERQGRQGWCNGYYLCGTLAYTEVPLALVYQAIVVDNIQNLSILPYCLAVVTIEQL